jgi:hypothetical protein
MSLHLLPDVNAPAPDHRPCSVKAPAIAKSEERSIHIRIDVMASREESAAMGRAINAIVEPEYIPVVRLRPASPCVALAGGALAVTQGRMLISRIWV